MNACLFHVFRNTPLGREIFLQSIYFCKTLDLTLCIYIPEFKRFLMNFENNTFPVDLDKSYLASPETAVSHSKELVDRRRVRANWIIPDSISNSTFPCIRNAFDFMCCPRSLQNGSAKIRLGHIGSKVRRILNLAPFPVLISSPVYKPWQRIAVFCESWDTSTDALQLGLKISDASGLPIDVYTLQENIGDNRPKTILQNSVLRNGAKKRSYTWHQYGKKHFVDNLYTVSHEALVILKCNSNASVRVYSSTMEKIQSTIPNNLLIIGPRYQPRPGFYDNPAAYNRSQRNHRAKAPAH